LRGWKIYETKILKPGHAGQRAAGGRTDDREDPVGGGVCPRNRRPMKFMASKCDVDDEWSGDYRQ